MEGKNKINIQIGENVLTATLVENSSAEALFAMLEAGPLTIHMNDYAGMEKVGSIGKLLCIWETPWSSTTSQILGTLPAWAGLKA